MMIKWSGPGTEPDWKQRPVSPGTRLRLAVATAAAGGVVAGVTLAALLSGTPASCGAAVDKANEVIALQASSMKLASEGIKAIAGGSFASLRDISNEIDAKTDQLRVVVPEYRQQAGECRGD